MKTITILLLVLFVVKSQAQWAPGSLAGETSGAQRDSCRGVLIQVYMGGKFKGNTYSTSDGHYILNRLEPGYYDILATYDGYDSMIAKTVVVTPDQRTTLNFKMHEANGRAKCIDIDEENRKKWEKYEIRETQY